jgi:hypothetical protein
MSTDVLGYRSASRTGGHFVKFQERSHFKAAVLKQKQSTFGCKRFHEQLQLDVDRQTDRQTDFGFSKV